MNRKLNIIYAAPNRRRERRNNIKMKKLASLALAGTLTLGLLPAFSSPALAAEGDTGYTLTIPATLAVENSGWNSIGDLTATGTLAQGKKLNVTATSEIKRIFAVGSHNFHFKSALSTMPGAGFCADMT